MYRWYCRHYRCYITIHLHTETIISAHMHVYMTNNTRSPSSSNSPQNDGPWLIVWRPNCMVEHQKGPNLQCRLLSRISVAANKWMWPSTKGTEPIWMVLESAKNGDIANINEHIATSASIFWVFTTVEDSPSSHMSTCPRTSLWTSFHMHRLFHGDVRLARSEFPRMGSTPWTANIHKPSSKPNC